MKNLDVSKRTLSWTSSLVFVIFFAMFCAPGLSYGQDQKEIRGKIIDSTGEALPGAKQVKAFLQTLMVVILSTQETMMYSFSLFRVMKSKKFL